MNINIEDLKNIKEELDSLKDDGVLYIDENGKTKYAILPIDVYDQVEEILATLNDNNSTSIKMLNFDELNLSYEEYENIRKQIIDAVDKTLKPKPEKLN